MNIILTSAGLKMPAVRHAVLKLLPQPPAELKIAHITTASRVQPDTAYVKKERVAMRDCGFQFTDISLENLTPDTTFAVLNNYDILNISGGNPFYLLKHARACGFEQAVRRFLQDPNKLYIGISAGSFIACPTIEMATWIPNLEDRYGLDDLTAMNLVPFLVVVHYNRDKYRELLPEKIPSASHPVKILTDDQAFFIKDGGVRLLGEGPEILASAVTQQQ